MSLENTVHRIEKKLDILLQHLGADYSKEDWQILAATHKIEEATKNLEDATSKLPPPPATT